jgi:hypothetical protein
VAPIHAFEITGHDGPEALAEHLRGLIGQVTDRNAERTPFTILIRPKAGLVEAHDVQIVIGGFDNGCKDGGRPTRWWHVDGRIVNYGPGETLHWMAPFIQHNGGFSGIIDTEHTPGGQLGAIGAGHWNFTPLSAD